MVLQLSIPKMHVVAITVDRKPCALQKNASRHAIDTGAGEHSSFGMGHRRLNSFAVVLP